MAITSYDNIKAVILKELSDGEMETKDLAMRLAEQQINLDNKQLYNMIARLSQGGLLSKDEESGLIRLEAGGRCYYDEFCEVVSLLFPEKSGAQEEMDESEVMAGIFLEEDGKDAKDISVRDDEALEKIHELWDEIRSQLFYDGSRIRIKKKDNGVSYRVRGPQKNHCRKSLFNAMRGFRSGERKIIVGLS